VAAQVVKPANTTPSASQEEAVPTKEQWIEQRRKIQDRQYIGRDI